MSDPERSSGSDTDDFGPVLNRTVNPKFVHVYQPPAGANRRTLLLLHGTGGNERDLLPLASILAPGAAVLSPRGNVLERGMPRFFRRLAEGVFDIDDLKSRTHELADFVAAAATHYGFDPTQVIAAGFSNGANIASSVMLLRPNVLRAGILFSPMVPLEPDPLPDLRAVGVFVNAGRSDAIVEPENVERLVALLERARARVTLRWTPGGHSLAAEDAQAARAWLDFEVPAG